MVKRTLMVCCLCLLNVIIHSKDTNQYIILQKTNDTFTRNVERAFNIAQKKTELINTIQRYIDIKSNRLSKVSAEEYVRVSLLYDLDITFMLAHHLLESHFGAYGKARKTNSLANVGTWDDGTIKYRYQTPDKCIEPYAKLIVNEYLRGRSLHFVLNNKLLENKNGHRFSTDVNCENKILNKMAKINRSTNIDDLFLEYKKLQSN